MGKLGRKAKFVRDDEGREIHGLYAEKTAQKIDDHTPLIRFYSRDASGSRVFHGNNRDTPSAVWNFRQWEKEQGGKQTVKIDRPAVVKIGGKTIQTVDVRMNQYGPEALIFPPDTDPEDLKQAVKSKTAVTQQPEKAEVSEAAYLARVKHDLENNLEWLAAGTNKPILLRLASLPKTDPGPTLRELWTSYLAYVQGRGKLQDKREVEKVSSWWEDFAKITAAATASEITEAAMDRYLTETVKQGSRKNRHISIAAILRHKHNRGSPHPELVRIHSLAKMLETPVSNGNDPNPISKSDFQKLLTEAAAANVKQTGFWEAVYLTALNLAYYPIDIARFPKSAINLTTGAVVFQREKTDVPRVGVLWSRTLDALKRYWSANAAAGDSELCFLNNAGKPFLTTTFCQNFQTRRNAAGCPLVEFGHLRDGAQTAAIQGGANPLHADILLGHRAPGIKDAYLKRNPEMVRDACEAIERFYFDDQSKPSTKSKKAGKK